MKLKDMTENIKTRSAEPLNDDELENVSGGRFDGAFGRAIRNIVYYYIRCTVCGYKVECPDEDTAKKEYSLRCREHNRKCNCNGRLDIIPDNAENPLG